MVGESENKSKKIMKIGHICKKLRQIRTFGKNSYFAYLRTAN